MVEFSIIIPFKAPNPDLDEALFHIDKLEKATFEVILLPDQNMELRPEQKRGYIHILPTGPVSPAIKRDQGAEKAQGTYLAFLDDDAYPEPNWLQRARQEWQKEPDLVGLGGPASTPPSDEFWSRVSGAVFLSKLSGGFPERYVSLPPERYVEDWPSVNLLVKRQAFLQVGGFDSAYWPGEDTKLCLDLVEKTGEKIKYLPDLKVWHHRRASLKKHLRQVGNYGKHRGFFAKKFPRTSLKPLFLVPSAWSLFVFSGLGLAWLPPWCAWVYLLGWFAYAGALLVAMKDILKFEDWGVALGALPYIFLSHLSYGIKFVLGLMTSELKSSLGR